MSDNTQRYIFSEEALLGLEEFCQRQPPLDALHPPSPIRPDHRSLPDNTSAQQAASRPGKPHYWGHRERLRKRFRAGGHAPMQDYELLELLLFNAIPRIDVKPLAKALLAAFVDLNGVVAASEHRLLQVPGTTPQVYLQLKIVEAFVHRMARARIVERCVLSSWDVLMSYCKTVMAYRETEQFRILFLDAKNVLIADEEQARGTVNHVPVYPREVAKRALELNASAIILVHNHPSGDPKPSEADIDMTAQIQEACRAIAVTLHDHVIIGQGRDASFRSLGIL